MKRTVLGIFGFILAGALSKAIPLGITLVTTEYAIQQARSNKTEWNAARAELREESRKVVEKELEKNGVEIEESKKERYLDCFVNNLIPILNETGCHYLYNKLTTSESAHFSEQLECYERVKYWEKAEKLAEYCGEKELGGEQ